jgi:signal transduction histidine kinase
MTTTETVPGSDLAARVEQLIHEGTVRHITIEHDGHTLAAFPMAMGVAGALEQVDLARCYETERRLRVRLEAMHQASRRVAPGAAVVGNLYLADKVGAREFSPQDERLLRLLAGQAAVVIEQARLAEKARTLAVVAERNRIRKDSHDRVIQPIYALTLELESAAENVEVDPAVARERIDVVIDQLGEVIKNLRRHILGVQPVSIADQTLPEALAALLAETRADALLETDLAVHGEGVHDLPAPLAQDLLQIAREAVANVVRQARAGRVWVTLDVSEREVHMRIVDNGIDCDTRNAPASGHYVWRSLQEWAQGLGGAATIRSARGQGTVVDVRVPVAMSERAAGPRCHAHAADAPARGVAPPADA